MLKNKLKSPLIIVFDLDETLGSFTQLGIFCDILEKYNHKLLDKEEFFKILDQNPEYIRPRVLDLLKLVLAKKKQNLVDSIMIYTNNTGPNRWQSYLADYFSYKLNEPVFDRIIRSFKINGKIVEPERTSHEKIYSDLLKCTKMPEDTIVYFIDDVEHPKMIHENVYYVKVKPYHNLLPMDIFLSRYANIKNISDEEYYELANKIYQSIPKDIIFPKSKPVDEQNIDILTGKMLISQMSDFFSEYRQKYSSNKSLKKYSNLSKSNNKSLKILSSK